MTPVLAYGDDVAEMMGSSGIPIPSQTYLDNEFNLYIDPAQSPLPFAGQPTFAGFDPQLLITPEELYPISLNSLPGLPLATGVNGLTLDQSVAEGLAILNQTVMQQVGTNSDPTGNSLVVFGNSQSAIIASLEMQQLARLPAADRPPTDALNFVLVADIANPNGGVFERFDGVYFSTLGIRFTGATAPDTPYHTAIYTQEYDGFADYCQFPLDLPCDLNAALGIYYVHLNYWDLTPAKVATAQQLLTDPAYGTDTTYYMIPTENLPLLDPLRSIPFVGGPLADLLQPDLTVIVNLGYGDPAYGWSTGYANVPTGFGVLPSLSDFAKVPGLLAAGTQEGITNFVTDIARGFASLGSLTLPSAPDVIDLIRAGFTPSAGLPSLTDIADALTDVVNTLTAVASTDYGVLLPTADIALAAVTTLPAYDVSLFATGLDEGNLLYALGAPIAADVGLGTWGAAFEAIVLGEAAVVSLSDLAPSLLP